MKIPTLMADAIDQYLATDHAKREGMSSRADLVMELLRDFFRTYERMYGPISKKAKSDSPPPQKPS